MQVARLQLKYQETRNPSNTNNYGKTMFFFLLYQHVSMYLHAGIMFQNLSVP
jgi:hypothetical protein